MSSSSVAEGGPYFCSSSKHMFVSYEYFICLLKKMVAATTSARHEPELKIS